MEFLRFLEGIRNPVFDIFFSIITYCGDEIVFMAVAMILFWCVSKKDGYYILTVGFIGTIINQFLKITFRIARPWVVDPEFNAVESAKEAATGYSFPSGHTQNAVGTFGALAYIFKKPWVRITCIALAVLVPFSRMYLGVHTPADVFTSVGIALVLIFAIKPLFDKLYYSTKGMLIFIGILIAVAIAYVLYVELFPFPSEVDLVDLEYGVSKRTTALKNAYTLLGALIGMAVSLPIERKFIRFETKDKWYIQLFKVAFGLGIVLGVKELLEVALEPIFRGHQSIHAFRYFGVVMVAVCLYPLLFPLYRRLDEKFIKMRNAKKEKNNKE